MESNRGGEWNPESDALKRVDEYDPATDTWTRKADMPTARGHTCTCVVNGKIYVIGGDAGPDPVHWGMPDVEVYDPVTDTWTQKADMPTSRFWFSTGVVDGIIYVIGGKPGYGDSSPHLTTVEAYDSTTDTWTTKTDMPTRRSLSSTCVVDGKIYVIGGAMGAKAAVEAYDPTTDTWSRKAPMPTARYALGTGLVEGKIYAIGGWQHSANGPIYSTVEVYDPQANTWAKGVDIPVATAGMSTSVVDGNIYVIGGAITTHNGIFIHTSAMYVSDAIVDFNGDGIVDAADMCIMVDHWGEDYSLCDIGPTPFGDGVVDVQDLIVLAEHLFEEIPPAEQVE
jgi:N-acetylneuraminic acid mutarotase